jgi:hypothetical protein
LSGFGKPEKADEYRYTESSRASKSTQGEMLTEAAWERPGGRKYAEDHRARTKAPETDRERGAFSQ